MGCLKLDIYTTNQARLKVAYRSRKEGRNECVNTYPFGLNIQNSDYADGADPKNNYQYNGKELNTDLGLNWMDYSARWYDPSIGRWGHVDPLAADFAAFSPYNYVLGNPISLVDPDGRAPQYPPKGYAGTFWEDEDGTFTRESSSHFWERTDCDGVCQGIYAEPIDLPSGAVNSIGFVDLIAQTVEALLGEGGVAVGLSREQATMGAATILIINDLKQLKVNKIVKNVDDLLDAAGSFKGKKTKIGENTMEGNVDDVFKTITEGGDVLESGAVRMPDGRVIHQHPSTSTGQNTITVDEVGQKQKKIRFNPEGT